MRICSDLREKMLSSNIKRLVVMKWRLERVGLSATVRLALL